MSLTSSTKQHYQYCDEQFQSHTLPPLVALTICYNDIYHLSRKKKLLFIQKNATIEIYDGTAKQFTQH